MACAPTGSGKTLAFVIPLLNHLQRPRTGGIRALVLTPTRELAEQVSIVLLVCIILWKKYPVRASGPNAP